MQFDYDPYAVKVDGDSDWDIVNSTILMESLENKIGELSLEITRVSRKISLGNRLKTALQYNEIGDADLSILDLKNELSQLMQVDLSSYEYRDREMIKELDVACEGWGADLYAKCAKIIDLIVEFFKEWIVAARRYANQLRRHGARLGNDIGAYCSGSQQVFSRMQANTYTRLDFEKLLDAATVLQTIMIRANSDYMIGEDRVAIDSKLMLFGHKLGKTNLEYVGSQLERRDRLMGDWRLADLRGYCDNLVRMLDNVREFRKIEQVLIDKFKKIMDQVRSSNELPVTDVANASLAKSFVQTVNRDIAGLGRTLVLVCNKAHGYTGEAQQ